jgi:hypothetical protein
MTTRAPMTEPPTDLEVTITHNLRDRAEVRELWRRRQIALDWGRKGPEPEKYTGVARANVELFHEMARRGAAVVAAYKGATPTGPTGWSGGSGRAAGSPT